MEHSDLEVFIMDIVALENGSPFKFPIRIGLGLGVVKKFREFATLLDTDVKDPPNMDMDPSLATFDGDISPLSNLVFIPATFPPAERPEAIPFLLHGRKGRWGSVALGFVNRPRDAGTEGKRNLRNFLAMFPKVLARL